LGRGLQAPEKKEASQTREKTKERDEGVDLFGGGGGLSEGGRDRAKLAVSQGRSTWEGGVLKKKERRCKENKIKDQFEKVRRLREGAFLTKGKAEELGGKCTT